MAESDQRDGSPPPGDPGGPAAPRAGPTRAAGSRGRALRLARAGLLACLPVLAFGFARLLLAHAAAEAGYDPWAKSTWCRGDSGHYLEIAMSGYRLYPCADSLGGWCGNTSWFPAYPGLIRLLRTCGVPVRPAALWIAAAFALATLSLVWRVVAPRAGPSAGAAALALAAVFPGVVYQHAAFPLSMFVFFASVCLVAVAAERPVAAGLAGAVAAASYTPGVLLAPVAALALLAGSGPRDWQWRLGRASLAAGLTSLGLGATLLVQRLSVGTWQALALGHAGYGYTLTDPLGALAGRVRTLWQSGAPTGWGSQPEAILAFHSLLVAAVVTSSLAAAATARGRARPLAGVVSLYLLAFWLFPLLVTEEPGDLPRRESMLLPAVLLAPEMPRPLLLLLGVLAALVASPVTRLFVQSRLV